MEVWYMINNGGWHRVTAAEYEAFKGDKRIWGPTHGTTLLQTILGPLRWV